MTDQHKGNTLGLISHEAMLHYVRAALPNRHQAKWQENILIFFQRVWFVEDSSERLRVGAFPLCYTSFTFFIV